MPQEPKKKHSKAAKRTRRASITLEAISLVVCPNCQEKTIAHMVCRNCGFYNKKAVTDKKSVRVTKA